MSLWLGTSVKFGLVSLWLAIPVISFVVCMFSDTNWHQPGGFVNRDFSKRLLSVFIVCDNSDLQDC